MSHLTDYERALVLYQDNPEMLLLLEHPERYGRVASSVADAMAVDGLDTPCGPGYGPDAEDSLSECDVDGRCARHSRLVRHARRVLRRIGR